MRFKKQSIKFSAIAVAVLALGLSACSDDAKNAVHNIKEGSDLQGSFNDTCSSSKIANTSEIIRLNFEGNSYTRSQIFYGEAGCKNEIGRIEYKGEFLVGKDIVDGENQGGTLDLDVAEAKVIVTSDTLAKTLNLLNYCSHRDYAAGKEVVLTGRQTAGLCPIENMPAKLYTSYRIERDNYLYLSDSDITTMTTDSTKRNENVVFEKLYTKDGTPVPARAPAPASDARL